MERRLAILLLLGTVWIGAETTLQLQLPSLPTISAVVNTITNTTFRVMRGGINLASSTLETLLDSPQSISEIIKVVFEEIRKSMAVEGGILGLPVLEPFRMEYIEVNITHEALTLQGVLEKIRIRQLSKFKLDHVHVDYDQAVYKLNLNLTFPFIEVDGKYNIDGVIGDLFSIFGKGPFWLKMQDLNIGIVIDIRKDIYIKSMKIDVKLKAMENNFQNLMDDEELGRIFNKAISNLAPEAVDIVWTEVKDDVEKQLVDYINELLKEISFRNIITRLFTVLRVGRQALNVKPLLDNS